MAGVMFLCYACAVSGFIVSGFTAAVPAAGTWTRIEIPAALLNLEGKSINSFQFYMYDGGAWIDRIGKSGAGCYLSTAPQPAVPSDDRVWMEDTAPGGATFFQEMYWDETQKASGSRSITRPLVPGPKGLGFYNATTTITPGHGETVVFYALLNECKPPKGLRVVWHTTEFFSTARVWGLTATGAAGDAPLPAAGIWTRYEVPAQQLGLENRTIKTMEFSIDDGQIWIDHVGVGAAGCYPASAAAPTIPSGDTKWMDDQLPGGASFHGPTQWDATQKASGAQSLSRATIAGESVFGFTNATETMPVTWDENLVFYTLINECLPPSKLLVQWGTTDGSWQGIAFGQPSGSLFYMGPTPASGGWVRVEIPASQLNVETKFIRSCLVYAYDGQAWVDHIGKSGNGCYVAPAAPPTLGSETVWMDDAIPAGASVAGLGQWDTAQKASGSQSMSRPAKAGETAYGFINATDTRFIGWGDQLVFYALTNECTTPSKILAQWGTSDGTWHGASWGQAISGYVYMGALPTAGTWGRMEVPANVLNLGGTTIKSFYFYVYDGQAWVDRIGVAAGQSAATTLFSDASSYSTDERRTGSASEVLHEIAVSIAKRSTVVSLPR